MFKAISHITDDILGLTTGHEYIVVSTKHQSKNSICVINDFGIHSRVSNKHITVIPDNNKLNIVKISAI